MLSAAMKFIFKKARELSKKQAKIGKRVSKVGPRIDDDIADARKMRKSTHESTRETGDQLMGHLQAEKSLLDTGHRRRKVKKDRRQRKFEDELPRN